MTSIKLFFRNMVQGSYRINGEIDRNLVGVKSPIHLHAAHFAYLSPPGGSLMRTLPDSLPEPMGGCQLLLGQAGALLRKRLLHTLRAWKSTTSDLFLPVLFVALAMGLFMVQPLAITYPPLKLTPGHYETAEAYFFR